MTETEQPLIQSLVGWNISKAYGELLAAQRPAREMINRPARLRTRSQVHNALLGRRPRELLHYRWQGSLLWSRPQAWNVEKASAVLR